MLFAGRDIFGFEYDNGAPFYVFTGNKMHPTERTLHYTMIFHTFVMMQVFNEINARKLGAKEYNVFKRFFSNWLFLFVVILTIVIQCVLVQYGGKPVRAVPLTYTQHGICIGIGALSLIQGTVISYHNIFYRCHY